MTQSSQGDSPKHGQQREFRQEVSVGKPVEFVGANVGRFTVPTSWSSTPVGERYCEPCGAWKPQRGILAVIVGCPDCGAEW